MVLVGFRSFLVLVLTFNFHGGGKLKFRIDRRISMKFVLVPILARSN